MSPDTLFALALFALASSLTPGPNNLMLMASGANFGFRRSIPHMLGISIGFLVLMLSAGLGLVQLFDLYSVIYTVLKVLAVAYMLWLAWKIAHAGPVQERDATGTPLTFLQAVAFQWVNPKAWAMALTAITVYVGNSGWLSLLLACVVFSSVNLPSVSVWTVLGQQMARILTSSRRLSLFNWTMAILLVASLYPILQL
ncbi:LysE family translocator [Sulfitobacter aestuariivivens]|uniref:LysE family translocator n=1 Tax=Sulfitobacter aestuariivivens TaxID=2766981 RepID=A0A927D4E0_9RHOB|nr:LysE family translocator [Sulfitobacter aestuariivivens]MBD3664774.1 LysE family translocator [Sulfitobacter aestuariivivens]